MGLSGMYFRVKEALYLDGLKMNTRIVQKQLS
jgi:hypothetical protein